MRFGLHYVSELGFHLIRFASLSTFPSRGRHKWCITIHTLLNIAKGHPDAGDLAGAVDFFARISRDLPAN